MLRLRSIFFLHVCMLYLVYSLIHPYSHASAAVQLNKTLCIHLFPLVVGKWALLLADRVQGIYLAIHFLHTCTAFGSTQTPWRIKSPAEGAVIYNVRLENIDPIVYVC
jgi:hypothetical protein